MAQTLQADVVRPVDGFTRPSVDFDIEKKGHANLHDTTSDGDSKSVESETFQNGVQRVRAITEIWSKKTLISMFILYVNLNTSYNIRTVAPNEILLASTSSNSSPSYKMPLTPH